MKLKIAITTVVLIITGIAVANAWPKPTLVMPSKMIAKGISKYCDNHVLIYVYKEDGYMGYNVAMSVASGSSC